MEAQKCQQQSCVIINKLLKKITIFIHFISIFSPCKYKRLIKHYILAITQCNGSITEGKFTIKFFTVRIIDLSEVGYIYRTGEMYKIRMIISFQLSLLLK